ncbi:hypothetical protein PFISCL1PPCAC_22754, partial [Pristionchus fissidentatus]
MIVVYGFLAASSEQMGTNFIVFSLFTTACVWEFIPGSCLLQYLTLCKPHLSSLQRLSIAYAPCVAMLAWSTPYLLFFYPSYAFTETVSQVHNPSPCDSFVANGAVLMPTKEHPTAIINFALECVMPTYIISYGSFAWCMAKSRRALSAFNVSISKKTIALHRKFMIMLILQNLLPLAVLSVPMAVFFLVVFGGYGMGLGTLIMSFSYWLLPIIQGSVALMFVMQVSSGTV